METIIQKNVEMGIDEIVPVFMERTVVTDKGQFGRKLARWQKISDETVKQCKRSRIPQIAEPLSFDKMLEDLTNSYDLVICPYENEENRTMKDALREFAGKAVRMPETLPKADEPLASAPRIAVIIGPEGGFSEKEIAKLSAAAFRCSPVTLGKTILRTETAGLAALAMIMYELEL